MVHSTSISVTALCNQPKAFTSDLGDDQSRYLYIVGSTLVLLCKLVTMVVHKTLHVTRHFCWALLLQNTAYATYVWQFCQWGGPGGIEA